MISEEELLAIKQRADNATKGPWKAYIEGRDMQSASSFIKTQGGDIELIGASEADFDFIANARQDIPRLIEEIERLKNKSGNI